MRDLGAYTDQYLTESFETVKVQFRRKKILHMIEDLNCTKILEIGCGLEPLFMFDYDNRFIWTIVEPSDCFYQKAVDASKSNSNVNCIHGLFEEIVKKDILYADFDFVICSSLLHEVESPVILLRSIADICKNETIVHINVPNADSVHRLLGVAMGIIKEKHDMTENNRIAQQNTVFDIQSLKRMVEDNGFVIKEQGSFFIKPFSHQQMLCMMKSGIIGERELEGLNRLSDYMPQFGSEIYVNIQKLPA